MNPRVAFKEMWSYKNVFVLQPLFGLFYGVDSEGVGFDAQPPGLQLVLNIGSCFQL